MKIFNNFNNVFYFQNKLNDLFIPEPLALFLRSPRLYYAFNSYV